MAMRIALRLESPFSLSLSLSLSRKHHLHQKPHEKSRQRVSDWRDFFILHFLH